jgi:hypothetical protein
MTFYKRTTLQPKDKPQDFSLLKLKMKYILASFLLVLVLTVSTTSALQCTDFENYAKEKNITPFEAGLTIAFYQMRTLGDIVDCQGAFFTAYIDGFLMGDNLRFSLDKALQ